MRIALTLAAYAVCAAAPGAGAVGVLLFCLCVFIVCGLLVRLFSFGTKPGRHPAASLVVLCWLLAGGVATWAWRPMLPFVPMTFVSQMYYRLAGRRLGRDVSLNTLEVNGPYLAAIGDNSVIGGSSVIGVRVHLRKGTRVPPGSRIMSPAGMPPHRVHQLERGRKPRGG